MKFVGVDISGLQAREQVQYGVHWSDWNSTSGSIRPHIGSNQGESLWSRVCVVYCTMLKHGGMGKVYEGQVSGKETCNWVDQVSSINATSANDDASGFES